ncbi:sulfite exporter TauE/SafE family protein [Dehalococcoidia bacterium]|nr:sulfite exporter TauE/SafE family protein [Dehalococcoidia bacterium]
MEITIVLFVIVCLLAFSCMYLDASIGMGYGTALTPLLLLLGFPPLAVVPAVLLGQVVGGLVGGLAHHLVGNINLDFRHDEKIKERLRGFGYMPRSIDAKVVFLLVSCGIIGAVIGVLTAVNIPDIVLTAYIGVMVLGIGVVILVRGNRKAKLSWEGLAGVGLLGAFNKGIWGGGYGPLVTGGQIISGREVRSSVGSGAVAEAIVSVVGFLGYMLAVGHILWSLAGAIAIGSVVAAPFAALTVRRIGSQRLTFIVGLVALILGISTLARIFI